MSGRLDGSPSPRWRSLLLLLEIFGAAALAASLAFHKTIGAALATAYLGVVALSGSVLIWRRKI